MIIKLNFILLKIFLVNIHIISFKQFSFFIQIYKNIEIITITTDKLSLTLNMDCLTKASLQHSLHNHNFIIPLLSKFLKPNDIANIVRITKNIWTSETVQINLHKIQLEYLTKLDSCNLKILLCAQRPCNFWLWLNTLLSKYNSNDAFSWIYVASLIFRAEMDDGSYLKIKSSEFPDLECLPPEQNPLRDVWTRIYEERWPSQYVNIIIKLGAPWTIDILTFLLSQQEDVWRSYYDVLMALFPKILHASFRHNYHKDSNLPNKELIWKKLILLFEQNIPLLSRRWICHAFQLHVINKHCAHIIQRYIKKYKIEQHWKIVITSLQRDFEASWLCPIWCPKDDTSRHFDRCCDLTCINLHLRPTSSLGYDIVCKRVAFFKTIECLNDAIERFASATEQTRRSDYTILTHLCLALELPEWQIVKQKSLMSWYEDEDESEQEININSELVSYISQLVDLHESFYTSMPDNDKDKAIPILNRIRKVLHKSSSSSS